LGAVMIFCHTERNKVRNKKPSVERQPPLLETVFQ
jgi:hypothetical protein